MNVIKRSEAIRSGPQKGFQDGTSKLTRRKCFGYDIDPDGELTINSDEAAIVRWIFDQYLTGSSLGTIAADLEKSTYFCILCYHPEPSNNREIVKTEFESKRRFDQCGIVMYLDSENWLKGSIEYENEHYQHLGSVVTNMGYSDWATTTIDASVKEMWYRFSRREDDYCIECSMDGGNYSQMRVCHMWKAAGTIQFGIYACSPEESSFKATFTNMEIMPCQWLAHDGQIPDED